MFNKIQPEQISLHTFSSPSGHMGFTQGNNTVYVNLNTGLTGDFNFVGNLYLNQGKLYSIDPTNTLGGVGNNISHGQSNFVTGNNCLVGGASNEASGTRNVILNGNNNQITNDVTDGTILAGYGGIITNNHDGAVLITDARVAAKTSTKTNSITLDFENGLFNVGDLYTSNDVYIDGSGLFSGNVNVYGTLLYTGKEVVNAPVMTGFVRTVSGHISGQLASLSGYVGVSSGQIRTDLEATGASLSARIAYDLDDLVRQTGNQIISGVKEFYNNIKIATDIAIIGTGSQKNSIILEDDLGVDISTGKNITLDSIDSIILLIDTNGDGKGGQFNNFNPTSHRFDSSLIVATGNSDPDTAKTIFAVHPSGIGWFKDSIIINYPSYNPTSSANEGISGQILWEKVSSDLGYLKLYDGTQWLRFSGVSF